MSGVSTVGSGLAARSSPSSGSYGGRAGAEEGAEEVEGSEEGAEGTVGAVMAYSWISWVAPDEVDVGRFVASNSKHVMTVACFDFEATRARCDVRHRQAAMVL
jgi:hypothetical protein